MSTSLPLSWQPCGHGADPASDPVGCRGVHVPGHTVCLAHLTDTDRTSYLTGLTSGADIDHRGTPFTHDLLEGLLQALHDPSIGKPHLGRALFVEAQFFGEAGFIGAQFSGDAWFVGAQFFGDARFSRAQFSRDARFVGAQFSSRAMFVGAQFSGDARFNEAQFSANARFVEAQFSANAWFVGAQFSGDAGFDRAHFESASDLGPLVCAGRIILSGAVFVLPVTLEIAAKEVVCERTRWESTATMRLRYATVDLSHTVLTAPAAVITHTTPFIYAGRVVREDLLTGPGMPPRNSDQVRVVSVQGVDAAYLVLTDADLTDCLFSGAFHLDQIRLEGHTTFAPVPTGWHRRRIWPVHWTGRRTLAEEHHWRAQSASQPPPPSGHASSPRRWRPGPYHSDPDLIPDPVDIAALYRQLRKAFEDGKNEPGAADFYYGECEMRRHDLTGTPKGERRLLWAYWLLSGYGLRVSRALGWLAIAMLLTITLLMGFGLPQDSPKQEATGTVPPGGGKVTFEIDKDDPQNPTGDRFNSERFEKALNITLNSVVFRSSGQNLTTAGTYIEMASRFLEPALLALGVLAVRGRIKR
ncbi:pentapeptide repeat-containing protein [Streptomyces anthocyanicus]|uniref:pentapeptide repeat-containing protein n=1 Tax=Streptomyces anthocyanicus TaxID=68174 RepID=UPI00386C6892|nr:pentapeptide repeat-containing protein [Streptomyces anthocyanicus]